MMKMKMILNIINLFMSGFTGVVDCPMTPSVIKNRAPPVIWWWNSQGVSTFCYVSSFFKTFHETFCLLPVIFHIQFLLFWLYWPHSLDCRSNTSLLLLLIEPKSFTLIIHPVFQALVLSHSHTTVHEHTSYITIQCSDKDKRRKGSYLVAWQWH